MRFYKWLIGFVIGIFITLMVAWISSYLCNIDLYWLNSLVKPHFMPTKTFFEASVTTSYALYALVVSRLVTTRDFKARFVLLLLVEIFSVVFVACFFTFKAVYVATAVMALTFALSFFEAVLLFLKDVRSAILYFPIFALHLFLFVLCFSVALAN